MDEPVLASLARAEAALQRQRLSAAAEERLLRLVSRRERPVSRRYWRLAVVCLLAACALVAWIGSRQLFSLQAEPSREMLHSVRDVAGFVVVQGQAQLAPEATVRCLSSRCRLDRASSGVHLVLERHARVRNRGAAIEVTYGRVTCAVEPRNVSTSPMRVRVSHGVIEVLGTRFVIQQGERGGTVRLEHGSIRFIAADGRLQRLRPGERLRWPVPAGADAQVAAPSDVAHSPVAPASTRPRRRLGQMLTAEQLDALLDRLELLRGQQRYREAASLMRQQLRRPGRRAVRERLSYELGALLTHQLRQVGPACRHWRVHLRAFGDTRYSAAVRRAQADLHCSTSH